jgi:nucleotide-binding universal stress UspA family protein
MYQRILVTTGGSPWSQAAVTYAIALAARTDAELRILTVITSAAETGRVDRPVSADPTLITMEQQGEELLIHAAAHATRAQVVYTTHAARGSIPAMIQQVASDEACDLIVMGARQTSGTHRSTLGSIVNAVAAQTPQPVLVIKTSSELAEPFGHSLLVATGGSAWSEAAVDHASRLAETLQLPLQVLHVAADSAGQGAGHAADGGNPILSKATEQAAARGITVEGTLASGDIAAGILAAATHTPSSALVLGSRGVTGWSRPRLGAIVNAVAARTTAPVLIVKHFIATPTT